MELFSLSINPEFSINFFLSLPFILTLSCLIIVYILYKKMKVNSSNIEISEASLGIGNNIIKFKPNYTDLQIAHKLWVELSTRKIGLKIDLENDVIVEIYNSWYDFFGITRELIKNIPVSKIHNKNTKLIIRCGFKV